MDRLKKFKNYLSLERLTTTAVMMLLLNFFYGCGSQDSEVPIAVAGEDQIVLVNDTVNLSGQGSIIPDVSRASIGP